jgi:hypothetical protein
VGDGQGFLAVKSDLDKRLISLWKPETADFLVSPDEVGSLDPERQLLRRMAVDPDDGIVAVINPYLAFE